VTRERQAQLETLPGRLNPQLPPNRAEDGSACTSWLAPSGLSISNETSILLYQ